MGPLTYEDLENLRNTLCDVLKNFSGDIAAKKKIDDIYLKIIEIQNEIQNTCRKNDLDTSDLGRLELTMKYNLDQLSIIQLDKDNLLLDF